ncbi:MAG: hypothetical protein IIY29_05280, partial [Firmicutes bacterium]|nr:hypothetical protein [Bacillota bacterium]
MKRKLFGIFLSLALVLSMMPMGLIAAQAAEDSYNLWLGDVQVTSENMNSIPGVTGGTASYDPVNHVLTMTNVTAINGVHTISSYESAKIYSVGDLTIKGSCKIDASQTTYGIRANGNLTLDADLEVNDAESLGVSVEGAKNIIINSGKINISSDTSLYGLIGGTGSTLTIKDGDITIKSYGHDEYGNGNGIDVGTFEMKGGNLSVVGHAVGLFAYRFYQTGGSIYAEGQISPGILVGNTSNPALEIKGDVEAVTKSEDRSAIQSFKSSIYINSNYYIKKPAGAHTDWSGDGQIIVNSDQTPAESVIITKKPTPYSLWIAGTQVTSANAEDLSEIDGVSVADGGEAKYNAETKTLALNDVTISNRNNSRNAKELAGIYSEDPLTISVTGTNTITGGTCTGSGEPCGIFSVKTLTFNGDGILTSTGGTGSEGVRSVGIHSTEAITFGGTGTINAMGAAAGYSSCGVRGAGAITVNSGTLNASGANGSGADSKGINAYSSGEIVINGGIVTATGYTCALNKAPTLGNGITAGGSTDISGSGAEIYKASNNANYKWVTAPFTTLGVKVSVVDTDDEFMLEGATMQVVETSGTGAETVVDEWSSTSEPHKITGLETGVEYVLRETVPPGGYTLAGDVTFTIDETGKVTSTGTITEDGTLLVENEKTLVSILATGINGSPLSNATIQVLDPSSNVVEEWSSSTEAHQITGLITGTTYKLHETVTPEEYNGPADQTFEISESGAVTYSEEKDGTGNLLVK